MIGLPRVLARVLAGTVAALLVHLAAAPAPAETGGPGAPVEVTAGPPVSLACLVQVGTTGLIYLGDQVPTVGSLTGSKGLGAPAPASLGLPRDVVFKSDRFTFSDAYAFATVAGKLYARPATAGIATPGSIWRQVPLPPCLNGAITSISADGGVLTAVGAGRQLYSHDMPGGDLSPARWTWRWGPFLWTGAGVKLPSDAPTVRVSDFDANETFTDTAGVQQHPIGVMTGYLLREDRRTITYIDPWLPSDASREVCGPQRGTLPMAALDASGSTVFTQTTDGRLFTRLYDFDLAGANFLFGKYTWQRPAPAKPGVWQLPAPSWVAQPRPAGVLTDRLTIATTGTDAADRELRIEARHPDGRVGYWRKPINAKQWTFVATGTRLVGTTPRAAAPVAADDRRYVGTVGDRPAVVADFNPACSPARLAVDLGDGMRLDLELHTEDALRQASRARELDDQPRRYNAAIVVPDATWARLATANPTVRAFVAQHLAGQVTELPVTVTSTRLRVEFRCWTFTLNGAAARPDAPPAVDVGLLAGTLLDSVEEQALPTC